MASLISEPNFINNNAYKYENILKSQLTRFIDRSPTFTTYYHINNNDINYYLIIYNILFDACFFI